MTNNAQIPCKWKRILAALAGGQSLNFLQAARYFHDTCLHSTVAAIERHGVRISRKDEIVPAWMGIPTHCKRYFLEGPEAHAQALRLLSEGKVSTSAENGLQGQKSCLC